MNKVETELEAARLARELRRARWLRAGLLVLGAAGSLTLAVGAASFSLSGLLVRPRLKRLPHLRRPHVRNLLLKLGRPFEDVSFPAFDGIRLHGWWMPVDPKAPTVIVLHGVRKNRTDVLRAALVLQFAGYNVLVFDGRGHGNSEGRHVTYGFLERRDVESAINWLIEDQRVINTRFGLAGESMGAAISLQVAAHSNRISAVWADSPFSSLDRITREFAVQKTRLPETVLSPVLWTTQRVANLRGRFDFRTVDPLMLASRIECPVYLVHGTADQLISPSHSEHIHEALNGEKHIWLIEGARHAKGFRRAKQEYNRRLIGFFDRHLR